MSDYILGSIFGFAVGVFYFAFELPFWVEIPFATAILIAGFMLRKSKDWNEKDEG